MGADAIFSMQEAEVLGPLLGDYAERLAALNREILSFEPHRAIRVPNRVAWFFDSFETIRKPLLQILARASQLVEHNELSPVIHDMFALRLADLETQLHHAEHQVRHLRSLGLEDAAAPLRVAAGLPLAKNGTVSAR